MAIESRLKYMMADRKISVEELSERVGLTAVNLSRMRTNKTKAIRFSTLEVLCRELRCQPGDLMRFVPDESDDEGEAEPAEPAEPATASL